MSSISGNIPNSNLNNLQNTQGTQTTQSTQTTGQGAIGQTGQVPEATKGNLNSVMGYAVMMESIMAIMPQMSNEDQDVLLASISAKLKDAQSKNDSDKIKGDEKVKSAMIQEQKSKFDESAKKIQKAIDDDKAAGPFKWLKAIFEAIASVVMMIVGAVLIATGVGAAVGALMITAGVIGLVMAVILGSANAYLGLKAGMTIAATSPAAVIGTVDSICEELMARREKWGVSYYVFQGDAIDSMAPVVARLSGN